MIIVVYNYFDFLYKSFGFMVIFICYRFQKPFHNRKIGLISTYLLKLICPLYWKSHSFRLFCLLILLFLTSFNYPRFPDRIIFTQPKELIESIKCDQPTVSSNYCCPNSNNLLFKPSFTENIPTFLQILNSNQHVCFGGWEPENCRSVQKVAIIIPYRDRQLNLRQLLARLHSLLFYQNIAYRIFVIEQAGSEPFNRGLLCNIGVIQSLALDPEFNCFIFHDVDLLPENLDNLYLCDSNLRQLSSAIDEFRFHVIFGNNAGGVTSLSKQNVFKLNGYPTRYWGWGSEDDELSARALINGLKLSRPPELIGRYKACRHIKSTVSFKHQENFKQFINYLHDGINFLQKNHHKYTVLNENKLMNELIFKNFRIHKNILNYFKKLNQCAKNEISSKLKLLQISSSSPSALILFSTTNDINFYIDNNNDDNNSNNNNNNIQASTISLENELLNYLAEKVLYTHFLINVTEIFHSHFIENKQTPEKSWLWFLKFYGWI